MLSLGFNSIASDSLFLKLHFVYGSKPKRSFKKTERKIFGGIHGGHVYTEVDNQISSFGMHNKQWHVFAHKKNKVGKYRINPDLKWQGDTGKLTITTIYIPITSEQQQQFKSQKQGYLQNPPYDYAFIGMRCAAGAYDMLSKIDVCEKKSKAKMIVTYFYPKMLRKRILKKAYKNNWTIIKQNGRQTRNWERD